MALREKVTRLLTSGLPTTFLDAINLTANTTTLNDDELDALVTLHDGPQTTDGAQRVLADVLKKHAKNRATERTAATKTLTLADSGKTVRTKRGQRIALNLETRGHLGATWQSASPAVDFVIQSVENDHRTTLATLEPRHAGTFEITLHEELAPPARSQARSQAPKQTARSFTLTVIVEP